MSWKKHDVHAFLKERPGGGPRLGRLATASAEGEPHVVPVWFQVDGDDLLVHTLADSHKARDIREHGRFSFVVDHDVHPYRGVTLKGRATVVGNDVIDSLELVKELAIDYLGFDVGNPFGEQIADMPGEHVTLVLHIEDWEDWDYS
jgi:PPOX class probable F420-dependent enzyme